MTVWRSNLDSYTSASNVVSLRFYQHNATGGFPHSEVLPGKEIDKSSNLDMSGAGWKLAASSREDIAAVSLWEIPVGTRTRAYALLRRKSPADAGLPDKFSGCVCAESVDTLAGAVEEIRTRVVPYVPGAARVPVGFWRMTSGGHGDRTQNEIEARPWDSIARNYPADAALLLDELSGITPEKVNGKIALFYGPPGTGKTTFLRSLAHTWRKWATLEYIIDPENFLNQGNYISSVMLDHDSRVVSWNGSDDDDDSTTAKDKWRLIVLEDASELIAADAKNSAGQALSRLLNIADGILGEGRNVIIAITTNEDIVDLHPAIVRPGRCLIRAELGKLSQKEAKQWLGPDLEQYARGPMTLAELYHAKSGLGSAVPGTRETPEHAGGQYL